MYMNGCLPCFCVFLVYLVADTSAQYSAPYGYPDYSSFPRNYRSFEGFDSDYYKNRGFGENNNYDGYPRSEWSNNGLNFYGPSFGRHYGQPAPHAHTHDDFDREKTTDEVISARINPLPHVFNAGLRRGLPTLQQIEARYGRKPHPPREPQHVLLRPLLLLTNPSKRR